MHQIWHIDRKLSYNRPLLGLRSDSNHDTYLSVHVSLHTYVDENYRASLKNV